MSPITITMNGEVCELAPGSTLADALAAHGQPAASFASAVNGEFVARDARGSIVLSDGDAVFTFQAITGG